jgi:hypothetical protein
MESGMRKLAATVLGMLLVACGRTGDGSGTHDHSIKSALDEFDKRQIYRTLDPRTLASIPDNKLEQAIIDYAATKLEGHHEREAQMVATLAIGVRALYLTWVVEAEVNNGGFNQYYWNTEDQFADQAVGAFEFFSATKHAALMREANRVREDERRTMEKYKNRGTLDAFSDSYDESKLGPLDERFYKMDENLSALRIKKVHSEPNLFSGQ